MKLFGPLLLLPALASAGTVFDSYESYYATQSGQLFHEKGIKLQPYSLQGDKGVRLAWSGTVGDRRHAIGIRNGMLAVDGYVLKPKAINTFPDEVVSDGDLGIGSTAYFAPGWICVENVPSSASGTAVRHKAVYLVRLAPPKTSSMETAQPISGLWRNSAAKLSGYVRQGGIPLPSRTRRSGRGFVQGIPHSG